MEQISVGEVRAATYKPKDSWWTVFLVDPYASHLVRLVAPYRWVTPNRLTAAATLLGLGSAACFALADRAWLIAGALLFHLSFVIDCMDGKLARLQGSGSVFGAWLDYIFDRFRVLACAATLMGGLYLATDRPVYLALGFGVVVCDLFHYLDILQIGKVRAEMRRRLAAAQEAYAEVTGAPRPAPETAAPAAAAQPATATGPATVPAPAGLYLRLRNFLIGNRIRPNVISGIEFQMAIFIVAPLAGVAAIVPVTALMIGLLLAFEATSIYRLWLGTRRFGRQLAKLERAIAAATPAPAGAEPLAAAPAEPALAPTAAG